MGRNWFACLSFSGTILTEIFNDHSENTTCHHLWIDSSKKLKDLLLSANIIHLENRISGVKIHLR